MDSFDLRILMTQKKKGGKSDDKEEEEDKELKEVKIPEDHTKFDSSINQTDYHPVDIRPSGAGTESDKMRLYQTRKMRVGDLGENFSHFFKNIREEIASFLLHLWREKFFLFFCGIVSLLVLGGIITSTVFTRNRSLLHQDKRVHRVAVPINDLGFPNRHQYPNYLYNGISIDVLLTGVTRSAHSGPIGFKPVTLLLLHEFPEECSSSFEELWTKFNSKFSMVCMNQRGFGMSSSPAHNDYYDINDQLVLDIKHTMDYLDLQNKTQTILVGNGLLGGTLSWLFASRFPEYSKALITLNSPHPVILRDYLLHYVPLPPVIVNATTNSTRPRETFIFNVAEVVSEFSDPEQFPSLKSDFFKKVFELLFISEQDKIWLDYRRQMKYVDEWRSTNIGDSRMRIEYMIKWLQSNFQRKNETTYQSESKLPNAANISIPTLSLWGLEDDFQLGASLFTNGAYVSDLRIRQIIHGTHWIIHQKPEEVAKSIEEFLIQTQLVSHASHSQ